MDHHQGLSDRAKALRPAVQAAFDAGGIDAICELIAALIAPLEARVADLEKRLNMTSSNSSKPPSSHGFEGIELAGAFVRMAAAREGFERGVFADGGVGVVARALGVGHGAEEQVEGEGLWRSFSMGCGFKTSCNASGREAVLRREYPGWASRHSRTRSQLALPPK